MMDASPRRYHRLAIILHWVMALAFFGMLGSGLSMVHGAMSKSLQFQMYQWHKSLGILLLLTFFLRLTLRLATKRPPLPQAMNPLEKKAALWGHRAFYLWMITLPLTGWLMVSASPFGLPTIVLGWFEWPHIPDVAGNKQVEDAAKSAHELLAYGFIALILGHVAAVVKLAVVERDNLLPRMGIGTLKEIEE